MYNKVRRTIGIALLCLLLISTSIVSNAADTQPALKIGDYIQFGAYNDEPILWRIIHIDEEGDPLLFSEYIISYKSFDAMELDLVVEPGSDTRRHRFGSNRWSNSNLREWLNSSDETVNFSTHPPIREALLWNLHEYVDEPGFLTNFTQRELESLKEVTHKSLLVEADKDFRDGGSEAHINVYGLPNEALTNYDDAYYENVTDKVFLLSIKELKEYVQDRDWDVRKTMTRKAKILDKHGTNGEMGAFAYYWLRTPSPDHDDWVRKIEPRFGKLSNYSAYKGRIGLCPALFLNASSAIVKSGAGTSADPFIISSEPPSTNSFPPLTPLAAGFLLTSLIGIATFIIIKKKKFRKTY